MGRNCKCLIFQSRTYPVIIIMVKPNYFQPKPPMEHYVITKYSINEKNVNEKNKLSKYIQNLLRQMSFQRLPK